MSLKIRFIQSELDWFSQNWGGEAASGEHFHPFPFQAKWSVRDASTPENLQVTPFSYVEHWLFSLL